MMRKIYFTILTLALLWPVTSIHAQSAREIVESSVVAMKSCKTLKGKIERSERLKGEMEKAKMFFKVRFNPYSVYIYNYYPDEGSEVLFKKGWNNNKAHIHPNKFPFVNVNLKPTGDLLLKDRHHTIMDVGFVYTLNVVQFLLDERGDEFDKYVRKEKDVVYDGEPCWVISIDYDEYGFEDYTVQAGEDLIKIDQKLRVPAFKVLEINDDVKDYFDVKAGDVIKVPNIYAQKVVLFVSKKNRLPIVQIIYDDNGLFEKYEYQGIEVNPPLKDGEFTPDWPDYEFKRD